MRWISPQFYQIQPKSRKSLKNEKYMKIMTFHEYSWKSMIFWIPRPSTKPLYSLLKIKVWAAWTPQNIKNMQKSQISLKSPKFHHFPQNYWKPCKMMQKNSFWRILAVPWPPHAENLNIPMGLLRFLTLPGRPETLQKAKKWQKSKNHQNSSLIIKFHEISPNFMKFR